MTRAFDSGLRAPQRSLIRSAIVEALAPLTRPAGQYLADVLELPWPISWAEESDEVGHWLDVARGRSPLVAVALGRREWSESLGGSMYTWLGDVDVAVYVVSAHQRGHLARIAGDAVGSSDHQSDPGIETMAEHVIELLVGLEVAAAGGQPLRLKSEGAAWVGQDLTVFEVSFALRVETTVNPARGELTTHSSLDARHQDDTAAPLETRAVSELPP